RFAQPWRVSAWCRGGGTVSITCGKKSATAKTKAGPDWHLVTAELPAGDTDPPEAPAVVTLTGPGEFDDVTVQEKLSPAPNLIPHPGFEKANPDGTLAGWSRQRKYRAIGPTYYVWTDWNHYFRENRGAVVADPLIAHGGKLSMRFDVPPG